MNEATVMKVGHVAVMAQTATTDSWYSGIALVWKVGA